MKKYILFWILIHSSTSLAGSFGCRYLGIASGAAEEVVQDVFRSIHLEMVRSRTGGVFKKGNVTIYAEFANKSSKNLKRDLSALETLARNNSVEYLSAENSYELERQAFWVTCSGAAICAAGLVGGGPVGILTLGVAAPITGVAFAGRIKQSREYAEDQEKLANQLYTAIRAGLESGKETHILVAGDINKNSTDVFQRLHEMGFTSD